MHWKRVQKRKEGKAENTTPRFRLFASSDHNNSVITESNKSRMRGGSRKPAFSTSEPEAPYKSVGLSNSTEALSLLLGDRFAVAELGFAK